GFHFALAPALQTEQTRHTDQHELQRSWQRHFRRWYKRIVVDLTILNQRLGRDRAICGTDAYDIGTHCQQRSAESIQTLQIQQSVIIKIPQNIACVQVIAVTIGGKAVGKIDSTWRSEVISDLSGAAGKMCGRNVDNNRLSGTG